MTLDIFTLMLYDAIVITAISFIAFFYKHVQKTYSGFGFWITSTFLAGMGYFVLLGRGIFIPLWLSVMIVNFVFPLVAILRLDGTLHFIKNRSASRFLYLLPLLQLLISLYYTLFNDAIIIRNFTQTLIICYAAVYIALEFFKNAKHHRPGIYYFAGIIYLVFTITLSLRAILWIFNPSSGLFESTSFQLLHFIVISVFELGWNICYFMLNSQRLEEDLNDSQNELKNTITELESALSEIKTLSGLVPICSSCKSIRDDKGYWNKLESFLSEHSDAQFSHGICPECAKKLYPELYHKD